MTQSPSDLNSGLAAKTADSGARRTRLREFQTQLVERMQAASSGATAHARQLGVMIGQSRWLLNLQDAGEIVSIGTIAKVPLTQDWFLGLTNIRGNLISVVDLAHFSGMPPTPVDKESRIVAFAPALGFNCGLLVSRVMGLRNVEEMTSQPGAADFPWAAQRYVDRDAHVWTELNLSFIVQDPRFLHVGL
ncbi:chemotaxis protein CheW [Noviherbaspirillum sp. UKPF54]|uniref:chemotaxis protein CheW n=1 Tax=Noviherbaspirillum sp. UKPF54 TaxID=2601898 RepID=UPI0011B1C083|nr:chemotaxis protein CheW [Noviherbaspirillum sp. UKPF54]QDZ28876.1 chemotaxis protein CheW [Noviherbaspirillum sp. UKPF54]